MVSDSSDDIVDPRASQEKSQNRGSYKDFLDGFPPRINTPKQICDYLEKLAPFKTSIWADAGYSGYEWRIQTNVNWLKKALVKQIQKEVYKPIIPQEFVVVRFYPKHFRKILNMLTMGASINGSL